MKHITYIVLLCQTLLLAACYDDYRPSQSKAVIEGRIDSDGYPVVLFTRSLNPTESGDISDNLIRWGKVTVSDGTETIVLTGGSDDNYFPPYRYHTLKMTGTPGRTYTIEAEYEGLHASASCTMPHPTPIKRITINPIEGNDTLHSATLTFDSPADCPAYYCVEMASYDTPKRMLPAMLGTVAAHVAGEEVQIQLFRPRSDIETDDYTPHFVSGEHFIVQLCRVSREVYDFWRAYDDFVMFGASGFIGGASSLPTNINGGYGVWSANAVSKMDMKVE